MKIRILSFTGRGTALNSKLLKLLSKEGIKASGFAYEKFIKDFDNLNILSDAKSSVKEGFESMDALIFIGAVGIAVRLISVHVRDKFKDPAVICIDEAGEYVIPILSGHVGGANKLALLISEKIGAKPVITTATDINKVFALDVWAKENKMAISDRILAKNISASLLENKKVYVKSEFELTYTKEALLEVSDEIKQDKLGIYIGYKNKAAKNYISLNPKCLCLGVGCKKGSDSLKLLDFCYKFLEENNISPDSIEYISSIDIKREEQAILNLADVLSCKLKFFSADELKRVPGNFTASEFVSKITGVDNVCERAACMIYPKLLIKKTKFEGMTLALSFDTSLKFNL